MLLLVHEKVFHEKNLPLSQPHLLSTMACYSIERKSYDFWQIPTQIRLFKCSTYENGTSVPSSYREYIPYVLRTIQHVDALGFGHTIAAVNMKNSIYNNDL